MIVVYFSSSSGYTKKFVESLPFESIQIPASLKEASSLKMEQEFVLVSPTYGGGSLSRKEKTYIPKQVDAFLKANNNHKLLVGTVGSGQANFGHTWYCKAPKDLSIKYNVPYLGGFEVTGLPGEKEKITEAIKKVGRGLPSVESSIEYNEYNAKLNTWSYDEDGNKFIDFDVDKEAVRQYHLQVINNQTKFFPSLEDKLNYLFENDYYEKEPFEKFTFEELKSLYKRAYKYKHRFSSTLGAMKFYTSYALRSNDGKVILERFEDRVVANAVLLSRGDLGLAEEFIDEIISGRLQPATPTFSNACKKRSGDLVSCFLVSSSEDSMASVSRIVHSALQLSKRGGGVGIDLTSMRCAGDPIKGVENQSTGVIPISKLLDDAFSYSNQLGQRSGAGVVYLSIHHPDFLSLLDAKRANADEKIRLKTLSIGAVVTDVAFELAKSNDIIYQFSPYDVEREYGKVMSYVDIDAEYENMVNNPRIRKVSKVPARKLFIKIAQTQSESGYPYLMFSAQVDRHNPITDGRAVMSNLCSEILQSQTPSKVNEDGTYEEVGRDVSCNLASLNIKKAMNGKNLAKTVEVAIRGLTAVADLTDIEAVPTVQKANRDFKSVGLGQFSLHEFFLDEGVSYAEKRTPENEGELRGASEEAKSFTNVYFSVVTYHALRTSNLIAIERGKTFEGFDNSKYADSSYLINKYSPEDMRVPIESVKHIFDKYSVHLPTLDEWKELAVSIEKHGLYNAYLQAVPPTGSISYINGGTSSIHPAVTVIEPRKEGTVGKVYYPTPGVTNENLDDFEDAYEIGPKAVIDVYAQAQKHVDQALSMTLFYKETDTTRTYNKMYNYAHKSGIKTIYYARVRSTDVSGTSVEECVSCTL